MCVLPGLTLAFCSGCRPTGSAVPGSEATEKGRELAKDVSARRLDSKQAREPSEFVVKL